MTMMMSLEGFKGIARDARGAIEECVLANRILANEGVVDAFGHVSVRNPENFDTFFQSRSLSPELVTKEDILEIDFDGNVVTKTEMKPYGERIIHAAILKARSDVNAVFHGHPYSVIPFSTTGVPIKPIAHFGGIFYGGIPVYDDYDSSSGMLISSPEQGQKVAEALGPSAAVLLRGHGCCVVGKCVASMVMTSIYLRDNALIQLNALALGEPKYLTDEEARQQKDILESDLAMSKAWNYWIRRAKRAMGDL